jgi:hypothetical protein
LCELHIPKIRERRLRLFDGMVFVFNNGCQSCLSRSTSSLPTSRNGVEQHPSIRSEEETLMCVFSTCSRRKGLCSRKLGVVRALGVMGTPLVYSPSLCRSTACR